MKQYGFIEPIIDTTHYVLGSATSLPKDILQSSGQWDAYLPIYEAQADLYETWGCTCWGTENALEILEKKLYGGTPNYDEAFIYNLTPIRPPGGDPHSVIECIRKNGLIPNKPLPPTFDEFCAYPKPQDFEIGRKWLEKYKVGHEWVFVNVDKKTQISLIKQALQYSPVAVSVTAWFEEDGIYVDNGQPNNHWCVIYGYTEVNGQTLFKVFDSYDHSLKVLHPDHNISYAKRYSLIPIEKKDNWLIELIKSVLKKIKPQSKVPDVVIAPKVKSPREILYETALSCLGTDASPKDKAPDELSC